MNIYDIKVKDTKQNEVSMSDYKGKALLIVNTATRCGNTPQYDGLEKLYEKYQVQGFEILDFPCNQFKGQAPGSDEEIASFCQLTYGTKFKTFAKIDVNGKNAHPLFVYLKENAPEEIQVANAPAVSNDKSIKWNFTKFLVNKDGVIIARFAPKFKPEAIEPLIADALK